MKRSKILSIMVICLSLFSIDKVFADECTDDMVKEYEQYANQIVITPTRLGESETFEIWAKNVTNNLAAENGRTVFSSGFLGYAQSGENFIVRVFVRSGVCRDKTIKEIKVKIPNVTEECDDCNNNENTNPPVVVEKPTTNTTEKVETDTSNNKKEETTIDTSENKKEETTTDTSDNKKEETTTGTSENKKEETTTGTSDNKKEETTTGTSENKKEETTIDTSENKKEETTTGTSINEKNDENTDLEPKVSNSEIIKNVIIFSTVTLLGVSLYYIIKRKRNSN